MIHPMGRQDVEKNPGDSSRDLWSPQFEGHDFTFKGVTARFHRPNKGHNRDEFQGSCGGTSMFLVVGQMILFDEQFVEECLQLTPWKFNSSPLKIDLLKRKGLSSNHHFSVALLNFAGVTGWFFDPASLCFGNGYKTRSSKMMENCRSTLCKIKI